MPAAAAAGILSLAELCDIAVAPSSSSSSSCVCAVERHGRYTKLLLGHHRLLHVWWHSDRSSDRSSDRYRDRTVVVRHADDGVVHVYPDLQTASHQLLLLRSLQPTPSPATLAGDG
jgi:hypothetical protein